MHSQGVLTQQINQSNVLIQQHQELAMVVISPTLVLNCDFVFVLDDIVRSKFNICALTRCKFEKEDLEAVFGDLAPRVYNLELLMSNEFSKGHSVVLVVEKEKAVVEI